MDFEEYVYLVKENDFQENLMTKEKIISQGLSSMIKHISNEFNSIKTQSTNNIH